MPELTLRSERRCELIDVTDEVAATLADLAVRDGGLLVSSPHTTAGVIVNEGYDPDVAGDLLRRLERLAPHEGQGDRHDEGNSDSHLKVALVGSAALVPVSAGELRLGRWQRIFFCEFDGPRTRSLHVTPLAG